MYKIATIPGDGTGPEVVREGLKVLEAVSQKKGFKYEIIDYDLGGDRYLKTGEVMPESVIEELKQCNAIFLGAGSSGKPEPWHRSTIPTSRQSMAWKKPTLSGSWSSSTSPA